MPLITCPDCGKQVSEAAPTCIHCGRPLRASAPTRGQRSPSNRPLLLLAVLLGAVAVVLLLMLQPWKSPVQRAAEEIAGAIEEGKNAYADALRSDLRNLVIVQEAFFADHKRYATSAAEIGFYVATEGNDIAVYKADSLGFRAKATRPGFDGECYVWVGPPSDFQVVSSKPGQPACTGELR